MKRKTHAVLPTLYMENGTLHAALVTSDHPVDTDVIVDSSYKLLTINWLTGLVTQKPIPNQNAARAVRARGARTETPPVYVS